MKGSISMKEQKLEGTVSVSHITAYLNRVKIGLFVALLILLVSDITWFTILKTGILKLPENNFFFKQRWTTDWVYFKRHFLIATGINWGVYIICLILFNKVNFLGKKILVSSVFLIITTVYCFDNWGFTYFSILYVLPIIFVTPLGKKFRQGVFIISLIMNYVYLYYQTYMYQSAYHFLISGVTFTALVCTFLISGSIYETLTSAILDIEQYSQLSAKLYNEITHDFVTGAYSKLKLHQDLSKKEELKSIAFLDLDDFKDVNDKFGHSAGDSVLQNLVKDCQNKQERIYRYGGDEFVILSKTGTKELAKKIGEIKNSFMNSCKKSVGCDVTFSAGVNDIGDVSTSEKIDKLLTESDQVMYEAKHNGKNQINLGA